MALLNVSPMPARPYSEYNIFFRLERVFILKSMGVTDDAVYSGFSPNHFDPIEHPRPQKYTDINLPPFWYSASHKDEWGVKRRKHRKIPGRIDFKTLSKIISANWRKSDAETNETKAYCKKLATAGVQFYKVELDKFRMCDSGCNKTNGVRNKKSIVPSLSTASDEIVKTGSVESNTTSPNQAAITSAGEKTPLYAEFASGNLNADPLMSDSLCHLDGFGDSNAPQEKQDEMIDIVKRHTTTNQYKTSATSVDSANESFSRRIEMQRALSLNAEVASGDLNEDPLMSDSLCHLDGFGDNNAPQEKHDAMIDVVKRHTTTNRYESSATSVDSTNESLSHRIEMQRALTNMRNSRGLPSYTLNDYECNLITQLLGSHAAVGAHSRSSNITPEERRTHAPNGEASVEGR